jgi:hypothetical protein
MCNLWNNLHRIIDSPAPINVEPASLTRFQCFNDPGDLLDVIGMRAKSDFNNVTNGPAMAPAVT